MALINYLVYCTSGKTLVPWRICSVDPPSLSFRQFYCQKVLDNSRELVGSFVGRSKEQADEVDSDLIISEVCSVFGHFVKFYSRLVDATNDVPSEGANESKCIS